MTFSASVKVGVISVLNPLWIQTYGSPFSYKTLTSSKGAKIGNDFTCLEPSLLQRISGRVIRI